MNARIRSAFRALVLIGAMGIPVSAATPDPGEARLEKEIRKAITQPRSKTLREAARRHAKFIREVAWTPEDTEALKEAVFFFHDIRAKGVLLGILATRSDTRLGTKKVAQACLDIFDVRDIPALYKTAQLVALGARFPLDGMDQYEEFVLKGSIRALGRTTCSLLGIPHFELEFKEYVIQTGENEDFLPRDTALRKWEIYSWWEKALRKAKTEAQKKGTDTHDVDRVLRYLEKHKPKPFRESDMKRAKPPWLKNEGADKPAQDR